MIGGMTPPCAIALATLLFKDKFTKRNGKWSHELHHGIGIYHRRGDSICSFGSASGTSGMYDWFRVAGALSMLFNCSLMAPHGGIFVFPVVGNALMYLVALVAGTFVSTALLGALKEKNCVIKIIKRRIVS